MSDKSDVDEIPATLYRYRQTLDHAETELSGGLFASRPSFLNDLFEPFAGGGRLSSDRPGAKLGLIHATYVDDYGVICFSEKKDDECMWAYYGNHRGFCLEYDAHSLTDLAPCLPPRQVRYQDWRPGGTVPSRERVLLRKSEAWRHEAEWRVLRPLHPQEKGRAGVPVLGARVTGVIPGYHAAWATKEFLRRWAGDQGVRFGRVVLDANELRLRVRWDGESSASS